MNTPMLRRVVTAGAYGSKGVYWLLFEGESNVPGGGILQPALVLSDSQVDMLLDQIAAEREKAGEP